MTLAVSLDRLLPGVSKPARYTGQEWNQVRKDWSKAQLKVALAYPDVYEVGMSNLGMVILYDLLNQQTDWLAERVYAPWLDMEQAMRQNGIPLFSLESRRPLREFDVVGFSLQYELNYSNVLNMLDLAGIPLLATDRTANWPLVMAGGSCTYNAEPLADFFDLFVVGEGEEVLLELLRLYRSNWGREKKGDFLLRAASIAGIYVPSLYQVEYHPEGTVSSVAPRRASVPAQVRKRIVSPLPPPPVKPVVPFVSVVHDRAMVEIMRGCMRGCRFCQAGVIYRPVRERPVAEVLDAVDQLLANTGHEEVSLLSLSSTDYTCIQPLLRGLGDRYAKQRVSISLPSLRTDAFSVELARIIQRTRKTGLTFAPEAGSERLRKVINKGITAEDLLRTAEAAYASGWLRIKLYFMIGLPTETMEDMLAIAELVQAVRGIGRHWCGKRAEVSVSVNTFVPKSHTPFQWLALTDGSEIAARQAALRRAMPGRGIHLSWSDPATTWLESALCRGDRRLGRVVWHAWRLGARFDAWAEAFHPNLWEQAFTEAGLDPAFYSSRQRPFSELLPWGVIDVGVSPTFLWQEYERSLRSEPSLNCTDGCMDCGIRDTFSLAQCPPPPAVQQAAEGNR